MNLIWKPLILYFVFQQVWIYHTTISLRNLIQMLFGMKFIRIIGMTLVIPKVRLFETPVFVWPNVCGLSTMEDSSNASRLSKLYFL